MSKRELRQKAMSWLSAERGAIIKSTRSSVSICLLYPNLYRVGISSLGFQGVYGMLNSFNDTSCERAFLPEEADLQEHLRTQTPIMAVESGRPLKDFDILAFSVSFENDYPNIVRMLELSGIPPRAKDRTSAHPLVIMGGVCAMSNPEPVAGFFDLVFIGEAEGMLEEFMEACKEGTSIQSGILERAGRINGVYVPSLTEVTYKPDGTIEARHGGPGRIKRRLCADISESPIAAPIISTEAEFAGMRLVEAMRGCTWKCKFCLAGHLYNPPRHKSLQRIGAQIREAAAEGARVGLIGPSLSDYKHRHEVLGIEGVEFSITSLRANAESAKIIEMLQSPRSVSIAPEAGTPRLRAYIDKRISEEDILLSASAILARPSVRRLRLYFMVGLPTEGPEDAEGIVQLVAKIRALNKRGKIDLTVSTFVPKPFTPFERMPMAPQKFIKAQLGIVRKGLMKLGGVSMGHDRLSEACTQGLLAMGDRRLMPAVEHMAQGMGYAEAMREAALSLEYYIYREKPAEEALPWSFIEP